MSFDSLAEYHTHVLRRITKSGYSNGWSVVKRIPESKTAGTVLANPPLAFVDGAFLDFSEHVVMDDDGIPHRSVYSYHYQRPDDGVLFYFRYERDPKNERAIVHEECHVHLNNVRYKGEELRFKTYATSFDEVFDFIIKVFYNPDYTPP